MDESSPIALILGALPTLVAVLKAVGWSERRGVASRLHRILEMREKLPEGAGRTALDQTAGRLAQQLAYLEDRRLRRRLDGANLAAIVVVLAVGAGLTYLLWSVEHVAVRTAAVLIAGFATLLVAFGGLPQMFKVQDAYPFEASSSSEKLAKPPRTGRSRT